MGDNKRINPRRPIPADQYDKLRENLRSGFAEGFPIKDFPAPDVRSTTFQGESRAESLNRKNDDVKFIVYDEGTLSTPEIPFSVAYANRISYMESRPPLEDIAELNIKAYQVQSDLDNQLHISAVPLLGFFGFPQSSEEDSAGPV